VPRHPSFLLKIKITILDISLSLSLTGEESVLTLLTGQRERERDKEREGERERGREREQKVWACSKRSSFSRSVSIYCVAQSDYCKLGHSPLNSMTVTLASISSKKVLNVNTS
jgi:hypothetical protein